MVKQSTVVTGWELDENQRLRLLKMFPPAYPDAVADHVTLQAGAPESAETPPDTDAKIVGEADDKNGVQALIVSVDGTTDRPDGSTYHLTWSLDRAKGRQGVESNDVIAKLGWRPLAEPIPIRLRGKRLGS